MNRNRKIFLTALLALAVTLVIVAFVLAVLSRLLVRRTAELVSGPSADEVVTEGIVPRAG